MKLLHNYNYLSMHCKQLLKVNTVTKFGEDSTRATHVSDLITSAHLVGTVLANFFTKTS